MIAFTIYFVILESRVAGYQLEKYTEGVTRCWLSFGEIH